MTKKSDWFWLTFNFIIWLTAGLLLVTAGLLLGILYSTYLTTYFSLNNNINFTQDCANLSLADTSTCLIQEVTPTYYYNMSNKGINLPKERLLSEGGVCHNYADYFEERLREIGGFYTTQVIIPTGSKITESHQFLVMSSKEGWCYLDQTWRDCVLFKKGNESI